MTTNVSFAKNTHTCYDCRQLYCTYQTSAGKMQMFIHHSLI